MGLMCRLINEATSLHDYRLGQYNRVPPVVAHVLELGARCCCPARKYPSEVTTVPIILVSFHSRFFHGCVLSVHIPHPNGKARLGFFLNTISHSTGAPQRATELDLPQPFSRRALPEQYEGLTYKLKLVFPETYPYKPPLITFETPCFHPNVDEHGNICLDILKEKWSSAFSVSTILQSLRSLLAGESLLYATEPCTVSDESKLDMSSCLLIISGLKARNVLADMMRVCSVTQMGSCNTRCLCHSSFRRSQQ